VGGTGLSIVFRGLMNSPSPVKWVEPKSWSDLKRR